jgi:hypothetical protein
MNTVKTLLTGICLFFSLLLSAQQKEPQNDVPYSNKIEVSNETLELLFTASGKISLDLAPEFHLEGTVENRSEHGNSVISLLINVQSRPGGMLNISRYRDEKGHLFYAGRLLKLHDQEGMMLIEKDNHYYFIETQQKFLVSE